MNICFFQLSTIDKHHTIVELLHAVTLMRTVDVSHHEWLCGVAVRTIRHSLQSSVDSIKSAVNYLLSIFYFLFYIFYCLLSTFNSTGQDSPKGSMALIAHSTIAWLVLRATFLTTVSAEFSPIRISIHTAIVEVCHLNNELPQHYEK